MEIDELLNRTNLRIPLQRYLNVLQQEFTQVRLINNYEPINDKYLLKIFTTFRLEKNTPHYILILYFTPEILFIFTNIHFYSLMIKSCC